MGISGVFTNNTWSHDLGFYWSWSEAQKGAKGQIKALVGGLPVTTIHLIKLLYNSNGSSFFLSSCAAVVQPFDVAKEGEVLR